MTLKVCSSEKKSEHISEKLVEYFPRRQNNTHIEPGQLWNNVRRRIYLICPKWEVIKSFPPTSISPSSVRYLGFPHSYVNILQSNIYKYDIEEASMKYYLE